MPCNSDYMNPSKQEAAQKEAAILYLWVCKHVSAGVPTWATQSANNLYGCNDAERDTVVALCNMLKSLGPNIVDTMLYVDARNKDARALAIWWENHQEEDAQRDEWEDQEALKAAALNKLTEEEKRALGFE